MILGIRCTTTDSDLQTNETTKELNSRREGLPDLGEGSWYSYETINEFEYVVVNGLKAEEIINVVTGSCETCRTECTYIKQVSSTAHLVNCDNGHSYYAVNCGNGWSVYSADPTPVEGGLMDITVAPPC